jgi:hypothetical protein
MAWRLAHSLEKLREQVNAKWPARSKDSDGAVGDARHQAERTSDHNAWISDAPGANVVSAIDITHDPAHGFDSYKFADLLLAKQDPRLKYVISNRRIGSGPAGPSPGVWRKYTGSNAHDHHCHISVASDKAHYDSVAPWNIDGAPTVINPNFVAPPPTVKPGSTGADVQRLQTLLGCKATGQYTLGSETEFALRLFQVRHGLTADGFAGPATWSALKTGTST